MPRISCEFGRDTPKRQARQRLIADAPAVLTVLYQAYCDAST
jgi:hypothetical protein